MKPTLLVWEEDGSDTYRDDPSYLEDKPPLTFGRRSPDLIWSESDKEWLPSWYRSPNDPKSTLLEVLSCWEDPQNLTSWEDDKLR